MTSQAIPFSPTDPAVIKAAIRASFAKLAPKTQLRNPVMFVVYVGSIITSIFWVHSLMYPGQEPSWFILQISMWLWFTVLFANFAESMAEGRGKAQAEHLKSSRRDTLAKKLLRSNGAGDRNIDRSKFTEVASTELRMGDWVLVQAGDFIPGDGQVIERRVLGMEGEGDEGLEAAGVVLHGAELEQVVDSVGIIFNVAVKHGGVGLEA